MFRQGKNIDFNSSDFQFPKPIDSAWLYKANYLRKELQPIKENVERLVIFKTLLFQKMEKILTINLDIFGFIVTLNVAEKNGILKPNIIALRTISSNIFEVNIQTCLLLRGILIVRNLYVSFKFFSLFFGLKVARI
jgi:hypothetical protein